MAQAKPTLSSDIGPQFEEATREALEVLRRAADEWSQGHPEQPPSKETLNAILQPFFERRFLRRPF